MPSTETVTCDIHRIPIELLDPHPLNPRLCLDENTVNGIAAQLEASGEFPREHAITGRRKPDGRVEIIRGHQRTAGAAQAKLPYVLAWLVDWDDDRTLMELGLSNRQGELTPLEVAIHSLRVVETAQGRAGMGVAEYARQMGYNPSNLGRYRNGARVYLAVVEEVGTSGIDTTRARHLAAHLAVIHGAASSRWSELARTCLANSWSVRQTSEEVGLLVLDPGADLAEDGEAVGDDAEEGDEPGANGVVNGGTIGDGVDGDGDEGGGAIGGEDEEVLAEIDATLDRQLEDEEPTVDDVVLVIDPDRIAEYRPPNHPPWLDWLMDGSRVIGVRVGAPSLLARRERREPESEVRSRLERAGAEVEGPDTGATTADVGSQGPAWAKLTGAPTSPLSALDLDVLALRDAESFSVGGVRVNLLTGENPEVTTYGSHAEFVAGVLGKRGGKMRTLAADAGLVPLGEVLRPGLTVLIAYGDTESGVTAVGICRVDEHGGMPATAYATCRGSDGVFACRFPREEAAMGARLAIWVRAADVKANSAAAE